MWSMPSLKHMSLNSLDLNWGPLSDTRCTGVPKSLNNLSCKIFTVVDANARRMGYIQTNLVNESTQMSSMVLPDFERG